MSQAAESSNQILAAPRELFEAVLSNLHEGVLVVAADGERVYANDEAARLTGYATADELLQAPAGEAVARFRIFDGDGGLLPLEHLPGRRALAGEEPEPVVVRFRVGEGPERVSEVRSVPVRDEHGAVRYAITFFREITTEVARAAAERAAADEYASLYRQAERTTALLDALYGAAPVGLGFWDRDLRYVRVNEKLAEINERPAEDHVGRTFEEVVPQLAHLLAPMARRVLETREPVIALELESGTPGSPDVPRSWLASYYPVLSADGDALGVGCVVEEITDRRRAERRTELQLAVTRVLADADATEDAVPGVLESICATLGWDVACFWSTDADVAPVVWARPGRQLDGFLAMTARATLTPDMLAGRVARGGAAEWLAELTPGTTYSVAAAEGLRSGVGFPVAVEGELCGVIEAFASSRQEEDLELLQAMTGIGAQLAQFLRRKRAEDERRLLLQREQAARSEAEAAVSTLRKLSRVSEAALEHSSLQGLLGSLLERIVEVLDADSAAILLVGEDGQLHVRATTGLESQIDHAVAVPMGKGMAGRVAALRTPMLVPDLADIDLVSPVLRERGINSLVAIPLVAEDRVIGVVHAGSVAFAQFVDEDVRLLELIADRIAMAINQAALYEAERAAQERLHFLGEASALLASSLDVDATLSRVARLAVPHVADWCAVDLLDAHGQITRVAVEHADAGQAELVRSLFAAQPSTIGDEWGVGAVLRTGEPQLTPTIDEAWLRTAYAGRPRYLELLLSLRLRSAVVVPLVARDRTLGALTFVSSDSGRRYGDPDLRFAQELAARAAVAVDNARLYAAAQRRRDRLAFLAEASALLGSSLDVDQTLQRLGNLLADSLADWAVIHLVGDDGRVRVGMTAHRDPERSALARFELDEQPDDREPPEIIGRVLGTGVAERWSAAPGEHPPGSFEDAERLHSGLVVPLIARSRILGTLSLVRGQTHDPYEEDDFDFAEDLARRAAVAIDNAQLYREAEERAQAARVLASVGDGVFFVDAHGIVRTWNRAAAVATGLAADDVVDRPAREVIPGWAAIVSRVPIVSTGSTRPESLPLDLGTREVWLSIHGVVVADGVVYAFRDLTEERALEAMRAEFVSTVSHELRTPLAAIYGAAMTLRRKDVALDDGQRATLLDVVSGEADRLARTVNDILWASRLDNDTLNVTIENCDPAALARDVVEAQLAHIDPNHDVALALDDDLPLVAGDPDKVGRVLINLVDNGLKYSPDGGRVDVAVRRAGSRVRFSVTDRGLGIPPSEQRRIFEKFYRLDPNMNRGVGGTGLGLYICRELVRRMDGRIWVTSEGIGTGSTFHVELPVASDFDSHIG